MGREIRRVPPNWEHPKITKYDYYKQCEVESYQPMYEDDFDSVFQEWIKNYNLWKEGKHPDQIDHPDRLTMSYWEWESTPPDPNYYWPQWKEEPTWYQVYETVSEGTPVTPPFATKEELINYLVEHGDFWDQHRGQGGWSRENAEHFVKNEWAPSMLLQSTEAGVTIKTARDGA